MQGRTLNHRWCKCDYRQSFWLLSIVHSWTYRTECGNQHSYISLQALFCYHTEKICCPLAGTDGIERWGKASIVCTAAAGRWLVILMWSYAGLYIISISLWISQSKYDQQQDLCSTSSAADSKIACSCNIVKLYILVLKILQILAEFLLGSHRDWVMTCCCAMLCKSVHDDNNGCSKYRVTVCFVREVYSVYLCGCLRFHTDEIVCMTVNLHGLHGSTDWKMLNATLGFDWDAPPWMLGAWLIISNTVSERVWYLIEGLYHGQERLV